MKKKNFILSILCVFTVFVISCSSDDLTIEQKTLSKSEQDAIVKLVSTNLSISKDANVSIDSVKLMKINDGYYLRLYHDGEITTTLLKVEKETMLKYAGISCTTTYCATDDGCIPDKDGKKCTKCGAFSSDCKKTVTSDVLTE
ncbi:hypothetical protein U8527_17355 [Kordia algicida OT-1]|uniref:Uncharacterized protein n=1 Tax=Kordia algicida OT-1 TaxID=391587 RepID=A9E327_9FLAO|nr:hypothetical protein [Kordia algicida]EDP95458.1 hypothetical protein KAOT1_11061 [Kordia algicida OT-1]